MNLEWEVETMAATVGSPTRVNMKLAYLHFKTNDHEFNSRSMGLFYEYMEVRL